MRAPRALAAGLAALALRSAPGEAGREPRDVAPARPRLATFTVACGPGAHRISPLVYGIAATGDDPPHVWELGATARRFGGNGSSRYNWQLGNAWNTNHDWFFRNVPVSARARFSYETLLEEDRAHRVATALTVPMLGWIAKDASSYAFPVSLVGPQRSTAPDLPDAGDGVGVDGKQLAADPQRTSVRSTPRTVERWARAIRARDRELGARRVDLYILDNEPMLWHETHRDVRSAPVTYDELLEKTIAYASAIRRADPGAAIAGPASWGWLDYHYSAADLAAGAALRPDRRRHGDVPLLAWYLREIRAHERRTGVRLLDVVDVHFYPANEAIGIGTKGGTDAATAALRIRSTHSLWDPTYVDESWIGRPMRVIPLLEDWIAQEAPGLGLSIGEWNFGAEEHMSGGLAVAEALGRFGVEGLHSAYYWTSPPAASPAYWAFRAYRNFDNAGARFLDWSVPVRGVAPLASLFASADEGRGQVVAVLLNEDPASPLAARLEVGTCGTPSAARAFAYAGGTAGFRRSDVATAADAVVVEAAPYSLTVVDVRFAPAAR